MMRRPTPWVVVLLLPCVLLCSAAPARAQVGNRPEPAHVGVVLDLGTLVGKVCWASISLAADDFYAAHPNYTTRLVLHPRDAMADVVGAGSAALGLLKNDRVLAILGPQKSSQARFLSDIANTTQVPIISSTATSPSLSSSAGPYFVRAALNDSRQVDAVASIVKAYGWREVVPIYEDTEYGNGLIPYLIDAMQAINVRIPHRTVLSLSETDDQIMKELYKLMTMQTRVFIAHMSLPMGTRLFANAKVAGMVSKGYAWILTDGIASLVDSIDPTVMGTMQGFLGVRPYVARTPRLDSFTLRWKRKYRSENPDAEKAELSIFGLWAYDAVQALAMAVEKVGAAKFTFKGPVVLTNSTDLDTLPVSQKGPDLLRAVLGTEFTGLAGQFRLVDRQLQDSAFQIVNVVGANGHREIGYWTPKHGISRQVKPPSPEREYSTSKDDLGAIIWPGDSAEVPRGWEVPNSGKKLRVGVPVKKTFLEFLKVEEDPVTKVPTPRGYCIDIFEEVMASLPYAVPYEYIPYVGDKSDSSLSYTELLRQVPLGKFDAVAGDVTILADRYQYVDFTLPYTETGVYMIVPLRGDKKRSAWIFLRPLTRELWLSSLAFFLFTGFVIWVNELRCHNEHVRGSPLRVISNVLYFTFSTIVFAQRQELKSGIAKAVVIVWLFVVLILTSSYTATLSSMLTVERLKPAVTDVDQLIKGRDSVGYSDGSFLRELLKPSFGTSRLVALSGPDEYAKALSNGTVAAVFHELPYVKLFLKEYCSGYTMIGPTQRTAGLGFVFPKDSPLLSDVSAAVLKVTQGPDMKNIERKWMETNSTCQSQDGEPVASSTRLSFYNLRGLFLITGVTSSLALLISCAVSLYDHCQNRQAVASVTEENYKRSIAIEQWRGQDDLTDGSSRGRPSHGVQQNMANAGAELNPIADQ